MAAADHRTSQLSAQVQDWSTAHKPAGNPGAAHVLIVNADDLGLRARVTDAILEAWRAGAISSSTLMVHQEDSERAAALARAAGLPVGLHLNLTHPFQPETTPTTVAQAQSQLASHFAKPRNRWLPSPHLAGAIARCIEEQIAEFERLFGVPPTHVDGHEHIQR